MNLVVLAGVLGVGLGAIGLVRLLRAPELRELRFLGVAAIVLFVLFAVAPGRPYYLAGLYGLLAAVGALGLQRRREAGRTRLRWAAWPVAAVSAVVASAGLLASVPTASPVVGDAVVATTARTYDGLPAEQRARTVLFGQSYVYAAYLDAADPELGLPPAYSTNRSYGYFDPPPESADAVLHVGAPDALRPFFADVRPVAVVDTGGAAGIAGEETGTRVWLLTGRQDSWARIQAVTRDLAVS